MANAKREVVCSKCGVPFVRTSSQEKWKISTCSQCIGKRARTYWKKRLLAGGERKKSGAKNPETTKRYVHLPHVMAKSRERKRAYDKANPEKIKARRISAAAIRSGVLVPQPCEVCGKPNTEGHHDDYSKPLDVRWLCNSCHQKWHVEQRKAAVEKADAP